MSVNRTFVLYAPGGVMLFGAALAWILPGRNDELLAFGVVGICAVILGLLLSYLTSVDR